MNRRQRRHGLSLIELSATIAAATLAMALVGMAFASLARVNARFRDAPTANADLAALRQALRSDLHATADCTLAGATLRLAGETPVTYSWSENVIRREANDGRRRFGAPEGATWTLQEEPSEGARLIRLTFSLEESDEPPLMQLVAEIGRDARLTGGAGEGEP